MAVQLADKAMDCYALAPYPPPPQQGTTSDLLRTYYDLGGTGIRKNWAELAKNMLDATREHSYARILAERSDAVRYDKAVELATRHQDMRELQVGDFADRMDEYKKMTKRMEDPPGAGHVDVGPSLPKTGDYLAEKPELLSPYERWVLSRKAAFVYRNKLPRLTEPQDDVGSGYLNKAEAYAIFTEAATKRNRLMLRRNWLCERYNNMVDECVSGVRELMNDNGYVLAQRERLLVDLIKSQNSSTLRKSLNEHVSELHDYINDMQFEIFKMEQLMMELNTISSAALQESDLVNEGKKKLLSSMDNKTYRYIRGLVTQKSDMYGEYRERIVMMGNICEDIVEPLIRVWKDARNLIKASVILTKEAVSNLDPECPLYNVIRSELKKTDTEYANAENAIEELGKDNSVVDAIEQMDSIFAFFADVGAYLTLEAHSLTAHMENKELIRSWTEFCPPKIDDEC